MGQQPKTESLFYYFCLQDQVSEGHLLGLIDRYIDSSFVRERLKDSDSPTGRPSVDPEVLLRLLLVGSLYGISSERRLVEEVKRGAPPRFKLLPVLLADTCKVA
jgi:transposase